MESIWLMFKGIGKGILYAILLVVIDWLLSGMPDINNLGILFGLGCLIKYHMDREFLIKELKEKK